MPLKPHPTDPDKMVYFNREYKLPKPWVGLTDEEINSWDLPDKPTVAEFARFVEAKLRSKNT